MLNFIIDMYEPFYTPIRLSIKFFLQTETYHKLNSDIKHFKKESGTLNRDDYIIWINSIFDLYYKPYMDIWRLKHNLMIPNTELFDDVLKKHPITNSDFHFKHVKEFYDTHKENPDTYLRWSYNSKKKYICRYDNNFFYQSVSFLKNNYCIIIFGVLITSSELFYKFF